MKKSLLLLIPALFLIASCGDKGEENNNQNPPMPDPQPHVDPEPEPEPDPEPPTPKPQHCPEGECVDADQDAKCDICGYPVEYQHAKSVGGDPKAPFILKVGEQKRIKAVLDPMPTRAIEKTFKWKTSNSSIATLEVDSTDTQYATVCGVKAGVVTFTATNDYSPDSLYHVFNATVVDFDEENMNLWEYSNNDKNQFGYTSDNKSGVASGTAVLNGISWDFTRSEVISLNTSKSGMLGFGKGSEPETMVKLVNHNARKVKKIQIESCSANGLANLTVKVGDKEIINTPTPSSNEDILVPIVSDEYTDGLSGDISIQFDTPEFDPSRIEDPTYQKPGCVYIKSFCINYAAETLDYKTEKTFDFLDMYENRSDNHLFDDLSTSSGKALMLEDEDGTFVLNFSKAKLPGATGVQDHLLTNDTILVNLKKTDEVIKYVELKYMVGSSSNSYSIYSSRFAGELLNDKLAQGSETISANVFDNYVNSIKFVNSNSTYVGLISLTIKTASGKHAVVDSVALEPGATPNKVSYYSGEKFDPTGLGNVVISFTDSSINPTYYPTSKLTFFDGQSYEEPEDHSGASEFLQAGTTKVVALVLGNEITFDGISVEESSTTFTLIKDAADIDTSGSYLITSPEAKAVCLGSSGTNIDAADGCTVLSNIDFGDSITVPNIYGNETFKIGKQDDKFSFTAPTGNMFGLTNSGTSHAKDPAYKYWTVSIDSETGLATITAVNGAGDTYYLGFGGTKFSSYKSAKSNIALYKLS